MTSVAFMNDPITQVAIAEISIAVFLVVAVPPVRQSRVALIGLLLVTLGSGLWLWLG